MEEEVEVGRILRHRRPRRDRRHRRERSNGPTGPSIPPLVPSAPSAFHPLFPSCLRRAGAAADMGAGGRTFFKRKYVKWWIILILVGILVALLTSRSRLACQLRDRKLNLLVLLQSSTSKLSEVVRRLFHSFQDKSSGRS